MSPFLHPSSFKDFSKAPHNSPTIVQGSWDQGIDLKNNKDLKKVICKVLLWILNVFYSYYSFTRHIALRNDTSGQILNRLLILEKFLDFLLTWKDNKW